jgi:hypothetical protein
MRRFLAGLVLCLIAPALRAADTEFLRVWPGWRAAETFDRIGEYFGSEEKHGREILLRTDPKERGGYYFLVRVKHAAPLDGAKFVVTAIRPDAPDVREFTLPVPATPAGESVFQVGLTGAAWPVAKASPVAWKLDLVDRDGGVLATQKSFLWEKPVK